MEKVTGVCWDKRIEKWQSAITVKGVSHFLGNFNNHSDAVKARKDAEKKFNVKKSPDFSDLQGERFGLLTVIGDTGKRSANNRVLLCRHDDGTLHEISKVNLVNGSSTGIGIGNNRPVGVTGQRYIELQKNGKYRVKISMNNRRKSFGAFDTLEQAIAKRDEILQLIEQGKL